MWAKQTETEGKLLYCSIFLRQTQHFHHIQTFITENSNLFLQVSFCESGQFFKKTKK